MKLEKFDKKIDYNSCYFKKESIKDKDVSLIFQYLKIINFNTKDWKILISFEEKVTIRTHPRKKPVLNNMNFCNKDIHKKSN
jgi:hypothetical protein